MKTATKGQKKLIKEGYDVLECPLCDKKCYPTSKFKNGTIRYDTHNCAPAGLAYLAQKKSFSINIHGELIGY